MSLLYFRGEGYNRAHTYKYGYLSLLYNIIHAKVYLANGPKVSLSMYSDLDTSIIRIFW